MLSSHSVFSVLDVWEDKESAKRISPAFSSTLKHQSCVRNAIMYTGEM